MRRRMVGGLVLLLTLAPAGGCGEDEPCTLIGCADAVVVRLPADVDASALSVQVCTDAAGCVEARSHSEGSELVAEVPGLRDAQNLAVRVKVFDRITRRQRTETREVVAMRKQYPNGRKCGAACRHGTATVTHLPQ